METSDMLELVDDLKESIDELETNLEPLLTSALSATTKQLPVLDKAKLYTWVVYSIESLIYSYLKLNGVKAREHAVFKELTRVKQYFQKINEVETGGVQPRANMTLNKQAAGRIIKHALHANDGERAARELKEKLLAKRKLQTLENTMQKKAKHNDDRVTAELSEGEIEEDPVPDFLAQLEDEGVIPEEIAEHSAKPNEEQSKEHLDLNQDELSQELRKQQRKLKKQRKKEAKQAAAPAG